MNAQYQIKELRSGESLFNANVARSNRLNKDTNGYNYKTREGEIKGPFATLSAANYDLNCFIEVSMLQQELVSQNFLGLKM